MAERGSAQLRRLRWVLLAPAGASSVASAVLSAVYTGATVNLPPEVQGTYGLAGLVSTIFTLLFVYVRLTDRIRTVWTLADGKREASKAELQQAVHEVSRLPGTAFRLNFQCWAIVVFVIDLLMAMLTPVSLGFLARNMLIGAVLSPLTSFIAHFGSALLGRRVIRFLARGLTLEDVLEANPPRKARLRAAMVGFTMAFTLCPAFVIADMSFSITERSFIAFLSASPAGQEVIAQEATSAFLPAVMAFTILVSVLAISTALVAGSALRSPMREMAARATLIGQGKLDRPHVIPAEEDMWMGSVAFTLMQAQLLTAIGQLRDACMLLGNSSENLIHTFAQQKYGATEQATALNQTSATTEELARSASQIAENASNVAGMAERTLAAAQLGQRSSDLFFASMLRMRADNQAVADAVVKLNKRVQQIGRVVQFIDEIADKSDLLALNAELEGIKAGEVGRGFSLVAAEMRRLAENVMTSTREIARLIQEIRDATNAAVMATEAGLKATDQGTSSANAVQQSLRQILELARETSDAVRSISMATHQQRSGTNQLAEAMGDVLRVTEQSSVATTQMSDANMQLTALAKELKAAVDRFQVNHG